MLAWERLDDNQRALFESNDVLAEIELGPVVPLDSVQSAIFSDYIERRGVANPECGIEVEKDMDPIWANHLKALDREFRKGRAEAQKAQRDELAARSRGGRR